MCTSAWVQFKSAGAQPRGGPPGSQEGSGVESHVFRTPTVVLCVSITEVLTEEMVRGVLPNTHIVELPGGC